MGGRGNFFEHLEKFLVPVPAPCHSQGFLQDHDAVVSQEWRRQDCLGKVIGGKPFPVKLGQVKIRHAGFPLRLYDSGHRFVNGADVVSVFDDDVRIGAHGSVIQPGLDKKGGSPAQMAQVDAVNGKLLNIRIGGDPLLHPGSEGPGGQYARHSCGHKGAEL